MQASSFPPPNEARRPTESILYQTFAEHLATFVNERERELCPLPKFVGSRKCKPHHHFQLLINIPVKLPQSS
jgi:hypothetical protein